MFYEFLYPLAEQFQVFNLFRYITFRSVYAALTGFAISLALGPMVIRFLRRLKAGQSIRKDGPQSHLAKEGTPTMGGILIMVSLGVSAILWARLDNRYVWFCLGSAFWFGLIGFIDDFNKLVFKNRGGISARLKLFLQILGASGIMAAYFYTTPADFAFSSVINVPFVKVPFEVPAWIYFCFGVFVIVGTSNGVNFADGLDGLAIGSALLVGIAFAAITYMVGHARLSEYLLIPFVPGMSEVTVFCAALIGTCLGFLWYNAHPAQVFMGDTGSLALGGVFGTLAVVAKQELLLALVGGVFVMEVMSVILQVASFKLTGKRIFKMAPLHHHFELKGWAEPQVIIRFWIVGLVLMLLALSTFKLR